MLGCRAIIVRVDRDKNGAIRGTDVFGPNRAKLLKVWDPYLGEFLFRGRSIIVKGDTEHPAFQLIIVRELESFGDTHVIRARGKFVIPALMKIQFGSGYAVLHDGDPTCLMERGAWAANTAIMTGVLAAPEPKSVQIVASIQILTGRSHIKLLRI